MVVAEWCHSGASRLQALAPCTGTRVHWEGLILPSAPSRTAPSTGTCCHNSHPRSSRTTVPPPAWCPLSPPSPDVPGSPIAAPHSSTEICCAPSLLPQEPLTRGPTANPCAALWVLCTVLVLAAAHPHQQLPEPPLPPVSVLGAAPGARHPCATVPRHHLCPTSAFISLPAAPRALSSINLILPISLLYFSLVYFVF